MRAFLIDFENVKSAGLVGIDTLGIDDQVVILYSVNSNTISFEMHQKIISCVANVEYYQIRRGGKNSLDFQLSTMLGYLLASGLYTHLYIVSNDSGFDALYDFWTSGYLPSECVVYRRPNIAMSVAHSVFTGKSVSREIQSNVEEVDVTVTDSAAYEQFEMERKEDSQNGEDNQEIIEIVAEQLTEGSSGEQPQAETAGEPDDYETAALLGVLQAVQQQEADTEPQKAWGEPDGISAAARMRQAELDAEEDESYIPADGTAHAEAAAAVSAAEEPAERSRRRRGRPRRSSGERAQEQQTAPAAEKPRQKADPAEVSALSSRLESELADVCSREQRLAVAEEILLAEGKQEFYRGIIRRFGQKRGLLVYKAVKSDFAALKKK